MDGGRRITSMPLYVDVHRIHNELAELGITADQPLTPDQLFPFDQFHYHGIDAVRAGAGIIGLGRDSRVLDIGSGLGGPARYLAHTVGCHVTALELQEDLHDTRVHAHAPLRPRFARHPRARRRAHTPAAGGRRSTPSSAGSRSITFPRGRGCVTPGCGDPPGRPHLHRGPGRARALLATRCRRRTARALRRDDDGRRRRVTGRPGRGGFSGDRDDGHDRELGRVLPAARDGVQQRPATARRACTARRQPSGSRRSSPRWTGSSRRAASAASGFRPRASDAPPGEDGRARQGGVAGDHPAPIRMSKCAYRDRSFLRMTRDDRSRLKQRPRRVICACGDDPSHYPSAAQRTALARVVFAHVAARAWIPGAPLQEGSRLQHAGVPGPRARQARGETDPQRHEDRGGDPRSRLPLAEAVYDAFKLEFGVTPAAFRGLPPGAISFARKKRRYRPP